MQKAAENRISRGRKRGGNTGALFLMLITVTVLVMALIILLNDSLGWFATNVNVSGGNMSIKLDNELFELSVSGAQASDYADDSPIIEYLSDASNGGYQKLASTDPGNPSIICRMYDETPVPPDPGKISPGSYGYLSFDIVVKRELASIEIDLDFIALGADISGNPTAIDAADIDAVNELLTGHILFFTGRTAGDGGYYYSGELSNDTYIYTLADHASDKTAAADGDHYNVTLYWAWPVNYAQMAYQKGHPYLRTHALFGTDSESAAERAALIADMASNPTKYFYEYNSESVTVDFTDPNFANLYYVNLTDGYNNGDQYIGDCVHFLVVRATADVYE